MIDFRWKGATRRWPMVVFYDGYCGAQHTCMVYYGYSRTQGGMKRNTVSDAGSSRAWYGLSSSQIERRHALTGLRGSTRLAIDTICTALLHRHWHPPEQPQTLLNAWCAYVNHMAVAGYKKAKDYVNKANQMCVKCGRPACKKHRSASVVCKSCNN